ncbi:MAG: AraC family transcriptional regulator [Clostridia bacterium]|nr:AraC family transcriptional regulator [Clostridia bacterium]MBQ8406064.1 AraC family transcriptional regulator [Clostridia bacterium]
MGNGTNYYEKIADIDRYCYFVRSGETFRDELKHEIACLPHFHKNREFLFCLQGPQEVIISGQKIIAESGDIIYVDDFEVHSYSNCKNAEAYMLVLSSCYFDLFDQCFVNQRLPRLMRNADKNARIFSIVEDWKNSYRKEKYVEDYYQIMVNGNRLFLAMMEEYGTQKRSDSLNKMNIINILNYIDAHYNEDLNVETIARHFGFTKQYFARIFNAYLGENFRSYLNDLRVNKFLQIRKRVGKQETVMKIALDCGFNSEATFYRAYKNYLKNKNV